MKNNYNFVNVTRALRIISLLLVFLFAPLSGAVYAHAVATGYVSENETDPLQAAHAIINPGLDPMVALSSNSANLSAAANSTAEVNVTSNISWTATVTSASTWLHVSPASANGNGTLTFTADANADKVNSRTAIVLIRATGIADQTITVTQSQEVPSITLSSSVSGTLAFNLQFNLGGTFYIDWGNGIQTPQTANTLGQSYGISNYVKDNVVKIYGSGITNISANSSSLKTLDANGCKDLISLSLTRNNIETLDLSKNTNLSYLDCSYNELTSLDVSYNTLLNTLTLSYNALTDLSLTNNTNLTSLNCIANKLTTLDISNNIHLSTLHCYQNKLTALDVSRNPDLKLLYCYSNNLTFNSLPQAKPTYTTYSYAPQARVPATLSGNTVDISGQLSATDVSGIQQPTVYKWILKGAGTQLVKGTDYLESGGVFTFLKTPSDSIYCSMTNAALPDLKNSNSLRTVNLKVLLVLPAVSTDPMSDVEVTTATGHGNITDFGIPDPTESGVVWSILPNPTVVLTTKTVQPVASLGAFISTITGLDPATTYYIRAYATNLAGTAYGVERSFTTQGLPPTVTTQDVDNIGTTVARGNGTITVLGVPNPTEYGFVWSTSASPTTALLSKTTQGTIAVTGPFTGNITGLTSNTLYYVRAYATNIMGTVYGNEMQFTTIPPSIDIPVPIELTGFANLIGTASASQSFTIGGKLEADLIITAPSGYQVSESGTGIFGPTVTFTPVNGVVSTKTIDVRIASTTAIGPIAGNVVCSSLGAADQNVAVSGIVSAIQLTIADPTLTTTKVYDGTPKAEVTPTLVTGISSGDDVTVDATASYVDSNAGTGKDITVVYTISGLSAYKYLKPVDFIFTTGEIKKASVSVTAVPDTKTYDATVSSDDDPIIGSFVSGDVVDISPIQVYDNANAGTVHAMTPSGMTIKNAVGADVTTNYDITYIPSATPGIIDPLAVNVTAVPDTKTYDGTTASAVSPLIGDLAPGDAVNAAPIQVYDTPEIRSNHVMTASGLTIKNAGGTDATGNYTIAYIPSAASGIINQASVTVTAVTDTKTYDGNALSDKTPLVGALILGDVVNVLPTQVYDHANAGTDHLMIASGLTIKNAGGDDVTGNYTIKYVASVTPGVINPLDVSVTAVTETKTYNGNTNSSGVPVVGALVTGDVVDVAPTQVFDNVNVGTMHVMSASGMTLKNAANVDVTGNYTITYLPSIAPGIINVLGITVTAVTDTKTYDGKVLSGASPVVSTLAGGDVVNAAPTQVFDDVKVGTAHVMTASGLTIKNAIGNDMTDNYDITYLASATPGVIDPLAVNVTAVTETKIYDGSTVSVVNPEVSPLAEGDVVKDAPTQVFDTPEIGTTHVMTASGLTIKNAGGTDVSTNYTITYLNSIAPGIINQLGVTVTAATQTKTYDGTTNSTGNPVVGPLLAGDAVLATPTQVYDNANAGTTHEMIASGLTIKNAGGTDVTSNYAISYLPSLTPGVINPFDVSVTAVTETKTYNGNAASGGAPEVGALVTGDVVDVAPTQVFDNANVGTLHVMSASGMTLKNAADVDVTNNYTITYLPSIAPGIINVLGITVTAATDTKFYDGKVLSVSSPVVSTLAGGDVVNAAPTQVYDDVNVGTTHVMTASGLTIKNAAGDDMTTNYDITYLHSVTQGVINPLAVNVTAVTETKIYDGSTVSVVNPEVSPLAEGDVVKDAPIQVFDTPVVGTTHVMTASGLTIKNAGGTDVSTNYTITYLNSIAPGIINQLGVTVTAATQTKIYDGTTNSTGNPVVGPLLPGDAVLATPTQVYDNANAGTEHVMIASGLTIKNAGGTDVTSNYAISYLPSLTPGVINRFDVSVTAVTETKTYNGNSLSGGSPVVGALVMGDVVDVAPTQVFDNANVGTLHVMSASGMTLKNAANVDVTNNYTITYLPSLAPGIINVLGITVTAVTDTKTYDGKVLSGASPVVSTLAGGDVVNAAPTQVYDDVNVGTTHVMTASGLTIKNTGGDDMTTNYDITYLPSATPGVINPLAVNVTAVTETKIYDGSTVSLVNPEVGPLAEGDVVKDAPTQVFDTPLVGTTHVMTASGLTIKNAGGTDVSTNYTITYLNSIAPGIINQLGVTVTAATETKTYDGTTNSAGNPVVGPLLPGDAVLAAPTQVYDNVNAGTTHVMTASGLTIKNAGGADVTSNYAISYLPSLTPGVINRFDVSVTAVTETKTYNGNTASIGAPIVDALVTGDEVDVSPTQVFDNANVGTLHVMSASGLTLKNAGNVDVTNNYTITYLPSVTPGIINPLGITVNALPDTKIYDGNVLSGVSPVVGTLASGDAVNAAPTQVYDNVNVGTAHVMTASGLTIKNAGEVDVTGNYAISYLPSPASGVVTEKLLTFTLPDLTIRKVYNGDTKAAVTPGVLTGVEPLDISNVTLTATAAYDNVAVGTGKTITVTYVLIGSAAGNYTIPATWSVNTGIIVGKPLDAGIPVITNSKIYDGNVSVEVKPNIPLGIDAADNGNLTLTATARYDNANVATGKTITVTYGLTGSAASIYSVPEDFIVTNGVITPKLLTATDPSITAGKIYNGSASAEVTVGTLSGVETADGPNVILSGIASYNNANAGTGKTITCTYTLSGSAAGNYNPPINFTLLTGEITGKSLSVTAPTIITNKVYDGSTTVSITPGTISGVEVSDLGNVSLTAAANYDNIGVGKGKTITVIYTLVGSAAGNYTPPAGFTLVSGEIVGMPVTVSAPVVKLSKVYDGNLSATVTPGSMSGIVPADIPNLNLTAVASYDNATTGSGKTITVVYGLTGSAASIYAVPADLILTSGEITAKPLTASNPAITISKVYNATTSAIVNPGMLLGVVGTDDVTLNATATYDNIIVGTGKTITCSYTLSGAAAGNYQAPSDYIETKAIITGKLLTVVSVKLTTSKVYDATNTATFSVETLSGIEPIDNNSVSLSGTATYDNVNAGSGKNMTIVYKLSGAASGNYIEPSVYTITNGVILAKQLTITNPVVITDKMHDGLTSAVITSLGSLQGVEPIDATNVNVSALANYNNQAVGIHKTINVVYSLDGSASANYIAPTDFVITDAKISDIVTLDPLITSTTGCEGSSLDLGYTILTGTPTQYKITFDAAGISAGLQNVSYTNLPSFSTSDVLPVTIAKGTKDGVYHGTIQMQNELGIESPAYSFEFTINVSSDFIIAKFDDVVLCDNKSNTFTGYQWYKDGVLIEGATKQFYNDLDGLIGSYSLKLTTIDGQTLYTCAKVFNIPLIKKISVYPNPLKVNEPCNIQMTGLSNEQLVGAELSVYSMQGVCVYQSSKVEKTNSIYLPSIDGMYLGNVRITTGQVFPFKIIVSK